MDSCEYSHVFFFFNDTATTEIYTLSLHDALPICVVTHKQVEDGQIVQQGQGLMVVVPLQAVWVTANLKETQLRKMRPGQKAFVEVDTYGKTFSGHLDSIAGATGAVVSLLPPENATGNFVKVVQRIPVKIILDPIPANVAVLRPGMNVDATWIPNYPHFLHQTLWKTSSPSSP